MTTAAPTTLVPTTAAPEYFETCFAEYALGSPPGDFTEYWNTGSFSLDILNTGELGVNQLYIDLTSTNNRCACGWDDAGNITDSEVLCKVKYTGGTGDFLIGPGIRISGGANENGYALYTDSIGTDRIVLRKYVNGVGSSDLASHNHVLAADTFYWLRLRVSNDNIKAKVWDDGAAEGGGWDIDYTDPSPYLTAGASGLITYTKDGWCDWLSIATNGGTAQGPADVADCTTVPPTTVAPTTGVIATTSAPTTPSYTTIAPTTAVPPATTSVPTTLVLTTVPPTTLIPTTAAVTTSVPTTSAPTTVVVTTVAPTTSVPITVGPTTLLPTTLAPSTIVPTTAGPTVPPTTGAPYVVCEKELISTIIADIQLKSYMIDNMQLDSQITNEMRFHGNLC